MTSETEKYYCKMYGDRIIKFDGKNKIITLKPSILSTDTNLTRVLSKKIYDLKLKRHENLDAYFYGNTTELTLYPLNPDIRRLLTLGIVYEDLIEKEVEYLMSYIIKMVDLRYDWDDLEPIRKDIEDSFKNHNEPLELLIAKQILNEEKSIITIKETNEICYYENGVYKIDENNSRVRKKMTEIIELLSIYKNSEDFRIRKDLLKYRDSLHSRSLIIEYIKSKSIVPIKEFENFDNIINCMNGILKYNNNTYEFKFTSHEKLEKNRKWLKTFVQYPFYYDPEAFDYEIEYLFRDLFNEERVDFIYQIIAYGLMPTIKFSKAFMFYGPTHTGETTFLNLLNRFYGSKNTCDVPLSKLAERFQLINLMGKVANIHDDLESENKLEYTSAFKKVVTNRYLSGEIKFTKRHVEWINRCKQYYATNDLPPVKYGTAMAFYIRWILIPMFNEFTKDNNNCETDVRNKKWSKEAFSTLLNSCLEAFITLDKNNGFPSEWDDPEYVKKRWEMDTNYAGTFIYEECEIKEGNEIDYDLFINACNFHRITNKALPVSKTNITKSIRQINPTIKKVRVDTKIHTESCGYKYINITIKEEFLNKYKDIFSKNTTNKPLTDF